MSIILENTQVKYIHDEIHVANINPIHLHIMNSNYLHVLDEMLRQSNENHKNFVGNINNDDLQYVIETIISLYCIYYFIDTVINSMYEK